MKILLCHCFYRSSAPSGEDSVYINEKKLLTDAGIDVEVYEKRNDDVDESSLYKKIKLGLETSWSNKSYKELTDILIRVSPDVVHFHNTFPQMSPSVYKACSDYGVPVVQTLHNFRYICPGAMLQRNNIPCEKCLSEGVFPLSSLIHKCYRNSILATFSLALMITRNRLNGVFNNFVTRYIALTEFSESRFVKGGLTEKRIIIKPNFIFDTPDLVENCSSTSNYVIYVGRLSEEKGIRTLLSAWKDVSGLDLKVLGSGPLYDELTEYVKTNDISAEFLGYQDKKTVLDMISKSKFMVVPSECYEGFPMTILEALSVGTAILSSDIGSLKEIIEDGKTGLKFKPGDSGDLLNKINHLDSNPKLVIDMGKNARSSYMKKYSPESNLNILIKIYNQAINEFKTSVLHTKQ